MAVRRHNAIVATLVPENRRLAFLPKMFGERLMLAAEELTISLMRG